MKKNFFAALFVAGVCCLVVPKAVCESNTDIDVVMDKLEQRWDTITSFSADVYSSIHSGDIQIFEAHGQYYFQRPLRMKVDLQVSGMEGSMNINSLTIDDGVTRWQVVSALNGKILSIEKNERGTAAVMSDVLKENFEKGYDAGLIDLRGMFKKMRSMKYHPEDLETKVVNGRACNVLRMSLNEIIQKDILRATRADKFTGDYSLVAKDILIYFYPEDFLVFRIDNISLLDESVCQRFEYSNIKIDMPMDEALFSYTPPAGVKVQEGKAFRRKSSSVDTRLVEKPLSLINQSCPEFSLPDLGHKLYRFKKLKGKILVITFWTEFRENSLRTLPVINKLYEKYKVDKNVRILTIARGDIHKIEKLVQDNGYKFPVLIDRHLEANRNQFFVRIAPMTFFVDKQGIIKDVYYGDGDEAEEVLSQKIILLEWDAVKKEYREYCDEGAKFLENKDCEEAIISFTKAIDLFPDQYEAYHMRGTAYFRNGNYEESIADNEESLARSVGNYGGYYGKGLAYMKLKQYDKAIESFNETLKIEPQELWANYNRGVAFYELGEYDKAILDYDTVLKREEDDADIYHRRGLAYERKGDYKRAIANYDTAIKKDKNFASAYFDKARILELLDEKNEALKEYKKFISDASRNKDASNLDFANQRIRELESKE